MTPFEIQVVIAAFEQCRGDECIKISWDPVTTFRENRYEHTTQNVPGYITYPTEDMGGTEQTSYFKVADLYVLPTIRKFGLKPAVHGHGNYPDKLLTRDNRTLCLVDSQPQEFPFSRVGYRQEEIRPSK